MYTNVVFVDYKARSALSTLVLRRKARVFGRATCTYCFCCTQLFSVDAQIEMRRRIRYLAAWTIYKYNNRKIAPVVQLGGLVPARPIMHTIMYYHMVSTYTHLSISLQSITMEISSSMIDREKKEPSTDDLQARRNVYNFCCVVYLHINYSEQPHV